MENIPLKPPRAPRKSSPVTDFVIKETLDDGRVVWVDPSTAEEITLNGGTVPTKDNLAMLAANGIVPMVPTLEDYEIQQQHAAEIIDEDENPLSRVITRLKTGTAEGARVEVKIYRVKDDRSESYCGSFGIDEYDEHGEELIRASFGPGRFRVRVYGPGATGTGMSTFVRLTNQLIEIEPSLIPIKSTVPNAGVGSSNDMTIQMLRDMQRELAELKSKPQGDPMEALAKNIALFKSLGLIGGKQTSAVDQLRELETTLGLREKIADRIAGGDKDKGGEKSMMDLAGEVIGLIKPALANNPQPAQNQLPAPMVNTPGAFDNQQVEGDEVNAAENLILNVTLNALIKAAMRGDDVNIHALGLADKLPDEMLDMLEMPIWFDMLTEFAPSHAAAITQHRAWFTQLRDAILISANGEDEPSPEPVSAPVTAPVAKTRTSK
jgi:hypothetical protein